MQTLRFAVGLLWCLSSRHLARDKLDMVTEGSEQVSRITKRGWVYPREARIGDPEHFQAGRTTQRVDVRHYVEQSQM
jgi:hypothetical protein